MSLILQNIAKHIVLNREEESLFLSQLETHRFKAKTIITEGQFANTLFHKFWHLKKFQYKQSSRTYINVCLRRLVD
jgi:hypothetical protein